MYHKNFSRLYSYARISRYRKASCNNEDIAQKMYYANARIAQAFQPLISFFEVILRNQLHYAIASYFNDVQWIINQKEGFMSDKSLHYTNKKTGKKIMNDFLKKEVERSEKVLIEKHRNIVAGRIIAELNFGFWNSLYEKHHYTLLKGSPCMIFKELPTGIGRKEVNRRIKEIRMLRNRISHNEPLCFKNKTFDLTYVNDMYEMIYDFFAWINVDIMKSLTYENLDKVKSEIEQAQKIILKS